MKNEIKNNYWQPCSRGESGGTCPTQSKFFLQILYEDINFGYKITNLAPQGWSVPPEIVKVGNSLTIEQKNKVKIRLKSYRKVVFTNFIFKVIFKCKMYDFCFKFQYHIRSLMQIKTLLKFPTIKKRNIFLIKFPKVF